MIGAVYAAAKFEKQLAMVSTMLDSKAMPIMQQYRQEVQRLAVDVGQSTQTLSKGLYDILSASIAPEKAMEVLKISAKAAAGGFTETEVAADAITTVLNSYGLAASKAGAVSDMLFATVKRGKLTFGQLAGSIGKAAATAAIAGLKLEELLAAVATITRAGIRSDRAMTAVVGVMRAFLKPTAEAKEAFKEFAKQQGLVGVELNTVTLRTRGLSGVLQMLTKASAEQLAQIFPNIRGLKGIAAAMQDLEGFGKDVNLMYNSGGMAAEAYGKATDTVTHQLARVSQGFLLLVRQIGERLLPAIRMLGDVLDLETGKVFDDFVATVGNVTEANEKAITQNAETIKSYLELAKAVDRTAEQEKKMTELATKLAARGYDVAAAWKLAGDDIEKFTKILEDSHKAISRTSQVRSLKNDISALSQEYDKWNKKARHTVSWDTLGGGKSGNLEDAMRRRDEVFKKLKAKMKDLRKTQEDTWKPPKPSKGIGAGKTAPVGTFIPSKEIKAGWKRLQEDMTKTEGDEWDKRRAVIEGKVAKWKETIKKMFGAGQAGQSEAQRKQLEAAMKQVEAFQGKELNKLGDEYLNAQEAKRKEKAGARLRYESEILSRLATLGKDELEVLTKQHEIEMKRLQLQKGISAEQLVGLRAVQAAELVSFKINKLEEKKKKIIASTQVTSGSAWSLARGLQKASLKSSALKNQLEPLNKTMEDLKKEHGLKLDTANALLTKVVAGTGAVGA